MQFSRPNRPIPDTETKSALPVSGYRLFCDFLSGIRADFAAKGRNFTIASKNRHASRIQRHVLVHKLFSQLQRSQITIFMANFRKCVISENTRILRIFAQKNIILKHTKYIILAIYYLLQYIKPYLSIHVSPPKRSKIGILR